jgi:uncharacterized membrane protein YqjE
MSQENLLSSIKNLAATGASMAQTRLELLSVDAQIARNKFLSVLVMTVSSLFFLFFGLVMLSLLIVIYSWESDRMTALGLLTGAFLFIGFVLALITIRALQTMPKLFEASIAEFAKDQDTLSK